MSLLLLSRHVKLRGSYDDAKEQSERFSLQVTDRSKFCRAAGCISLLSGYMSELNTPQLPFFYLKFKEIVEYEWHLLEFSPDNVWSAEWGAVLNPLWRTQLFASSWMMMKLSKVFRVTHWILDYIGFSEKVTVLNLDFMLHVDQAHFFLVLIQEIQHIAVKWKCVSGQRSSDLDISLNFTASLVDTLLTFSVFCFCFFLNPITMWLPRM